MITTDDRALLAQLAAELKWINADGSYSAEESVAVAVETLNAVDNYLVKNFSVAEARNRAAQRYKEGQQINSEINKP